MKIKPGANRKICNTSKLLSNATANQAPAVEVKGPTTGGKDVGAGQGFKQQQQH